MPIRDLGIEPAPTSPTGGGDIPPPVSNRKIEVHIMPRRVTEAQALLASPVYTSALKRAEQVLAQKSPSWTAKALAKDVKLLATAIEVLAKDV